MKEVERPAITRTAAEEHFQEAKMHGKKTVESSIACGKALVKARALCPRGQWEASLARYGFSRTTANRLMALVGGRAKSTQTNNSDKPSEVTKMVDTDILSLLESVSEADEDEQVTSENSFAEQEPKTEVEEQPVSAEPSKPVVPASPPSKPTAPKQPEQPKSVVVSEADEEDEEEAEPSGVTYGSPDAKKITHHLNEAIKLLGKNHQYSPVRMQFNQIFVRVKMV